MRDDKRKFNFYDMNIKSLDYKNPKDRVLLVLVRKFEDFEYYFMESQKSIKHAFILIGFAYLYIIAQIIRWIVC